MKFDKLVNSILNEDFLDMMSRHSLDIIDNYRGSKEVVATLVGDKNNSETVNGINGDGSDEFKFPGVSFDDAVDYGTEIGLWEDDGEGNLVVLDSSKWDEFYSETVSLEEDKSLDQWHQAQMDKEAALDKKEAYKSSLLRRDEAPINDDFIDMVKSMPTDQLKGLFREDLYAYYEINKGTAAEDRAQDRIEMMGNELLSRGVTSDELAAIRDEAEASSNK